MSGSIRPRRSALYMPGTNDRALDKARSLAVDAVIFDMEDSIAPDAKQEARQKACAAATAGGYANREVLLRVNGLGTAWHDDDLAAVATSGADGICVPKVESADDVSAFRENLARNGAPASLAVWAMIETPRGILNVNAIAAAGSAKANPVRVLLLGTNDIAKETRAIVTPDRRALLAWLSGCVLAARANGIDILDGVYNNFRDEDGLRCECEHGRMLGMDGKTLIHPAQIDVANEIFAPPAEEVAQARAIISAFELPENRGKGVISMDGKMVELLHRDMALRTVAIADAIERAGSGS